MVCTIQSYHARPWLIHCSQDPRERRVFRRYADTLGFTAELFPLEKLKPVDLEAVPSQRFLNGVPHFCRFTGPCAPPHDFGLRNDVYLLINKDQDKYTIYVRRTKKWVQWDGKSLVLMVTAGGEQSCCLRYASFAKFTSVTWLLRRVKSTSMNVREMVDLTSLNSLGTHFRIGGVVNSGTNPLT